MDCTLSSCQVQHSQHLAGTVHAPNLSYQLTKALYNLPLMGCRENKRAWLYRIRPSVTHEPFHPLDFPVEQLTGMLLNTVSAFAA
jgi:homogentisate 1,2-dioxygenase